MSLNNPTTVVFQPASFDPTEISLCVFYIYDAISECRVVLEMVGYQEFHERVFHCNVSSLIMCILTPFKMFFARVMCIRIHPSYYTILGQPAIPATRI